MTGSNKLKVFSLLMTTSYIMLQLNRLYLSEELFFFVHLHLGRFGSVT